MGSDSDWEDTPTSTCPTPNMPMTTPVPVWHHWRTNHQPVICSDHSSKRKRWISFLGLWLEQARKPRPLASFSTNVIGCLGLIGGVTEAGVELLSFRGLLFLPPTGTDWRIKIAHRSHSVLADPLILIEHNHSVLKQGKRTIPHCRLHKGVIYSIYHKRLTALHSQKTHFIVW